MPNEIPTPNVQLSAGSLRYYEILLAGFILIWRGNGKKSVTEVISCRTLATSKKQIETVMSTDWDLVIGHHLDIGHWTFRFIVRLLSQNVNKTEQHDNVTISSPLPEK